ncbi:hypothetical protein [Geodermatophilus sp. FMUSA9-8]|uniref:hypothetical protein n=1 Tax=Geodermatophilus sp. FMUSA9-8 TaxID=3120155 RepID=UPI003009A93D
MRRSTAVAGAFAAGLMILFTGPAAQAAATDTVYVPEDFVTSLSQTRATGHYEVVGTGLRVWTESNKSTDKVAEYVATTTPLAGVGSPRLNVTTTAGTIAPGFQLVVDLDGNGTKDGILVGEPTAPGYEDNWWLASSTLPFQRLAPHTGGGFGSPYYGTLAEWTAVFDGDTDVNGDGVVDAQDDITADGVDDKAAVVQAFGFSLGSGVYGDHTITSMDFAGTRYTFAEHVRLSTKNQCKNGGWATSTLPEFRNQGECVASFAKAAER